MRIGLDLDGVLYDWVAQAAIVIQEGKGLPLGTLPSSVDTYDIAAAWELDREEVDDLLCRSAWFLYSRGVVNPEASWFISELNKDGHSVHFVTSRYCPCGTPAHVTTLQKATEDLASRLGDHPVHYIQDKRFSQEDIQFIGMDMLLDDNHLYFEEEHADKFILYDQPWNWSAPESATRVRRLADALKVIRSHR